MVRIPDNREAESRKSPEYQGKTVIKEFHEGLKARDQMAWVGAMNNIRNAAEEIALSELI